jgi:hypothetical protein
VAGGRDHRERALCPQRLGGLLAGRARDPVLRVRRHERCARGRRPGRRGCRLHRTGLAAHRRDDDRAVRGPRSAVRGPVEVSSGDRLASRARLPGVRSDVFAATVSTIAASCRQVSVTSGSRSGSGEPPCVRRITNGSLASRSGPRGIRWRVFSASGRSRSPIRVAGRLRSLVDLLADDLADPGDLNGPGLPARTVCEPDCARTYDGRASRSLGRQPCVAGASAALLASDLINAVDR